MLCHSFVSVIVFLLFLLCVTFQLSWWHFGVSWMLVESCVPGVKFVSFFFLSFWYSRSVGIVRSWS
jgi:hypothetical protein